MGWSPPASDAGWQPPAADASPEVNEGGDEAASETGAAEAALHYGSGLAGAIAGGLAYLGNSATNAVGLTSGDPMDAAHATENALTYQPRTEQGQGAVGAVDTGAAAAIKGAGKAIDPLGIVPKLENAISPDPYGLRSATQQDINQRAMTVANAFPVVAGVVGKIVGRAGRAAEAGETAAAPKQAPTGPVTAEELKSGPDPLATAAPEPAAGAPGPQGAAPAAPAPTPPPSAAHAPLKEGTPRGAAVPEAQQAREAVLNQLNKDSGGALPEVRKSAVTGDYLETGTDYQHAKMNDAAGQRMQGVIASEGNAVKTAAQKAVDATGGTAEGVGQTALAERGGIINPALQAVGDWFDKHISASYTAADASAGAQPHVSTKLAAQLSDRLPEGTPEGIALQGAATKAAQKLGLIGPDGSPLEATGQQAERFRQWVGRQYKPGSASNGIIKDLKDAVDDDAAARGGAESYAASRALRAQRDKMLDGPKGISNVMNSDRYGNRSVPIEGIPDNIANMPRDQFNHVVNVLKSSAHLGDGELAEGAAAAINEIKGHMAARLADAGGAGRDGMWDPYKYNKQLDKYSLKMPAVFNKPGEMERFHTINNAGNILRMDKTYPGAGAQIHNTGISLRERVGNTAEGLISDAIPFGNTMGELTGIAPKLRRALGGDSVAKRAKVVEGRITKLGAAPEATLGERIGGAGQRGGPKFEPYSNSKVLKHEYDKESGEHTVRSLNGETLADDQGKDIKAVRSDTYWRANGRGEGTARMAALADRAHARGGKLLSDFSVSPGQGRVYEKLGEQGYDVKKNPNARINPETGNTISDLPGNPVYTVGPKAAERAPVTPLGQRLAGGKQRGAVGNPYDSATPSKDVWGNERKVNDRLPMRESRSNNPYETGGGRTPLGQSLYGGKQRGAVGDLTRGEKNGSVRAGKENESAPATVNIGLHVGDPTTPEGRAAGGRVLSKNEAVRALKANGADVGKTSVVQSGTEPTLVADLNNGKLDNVKANTVAEKLGQQAIVQRDASGAGSMHGPQAAAWGEYNPEYFRMHDGRTAAEHEGEAAAYSKISPHMTPEERAQIEGARPHLRAAAVQGLIDSFHGSTSTEGTAAMALAGAAKKGWYENSAKSIGKVFGPDAPRFTALLAAMSPQTSIEMNFHNALRSFVNWDKAGRPTDPGAIKKIMEDSSLKNPNSESESNVMEAWHQNGVRALTSPDPEHESFQLSGPKVNSFYKNLRNNVHEVTNDSWNAIGMNVDQRMFAGKYAKAEQDMFQKLGGKSPGYIVVSAKVRAAAKHLSDVTGEKWDPREVQETMWSFVKTAFEHAKATGRSIPDLIKSGDINDDLIRSTPDFHELFGTPEHRGFLDDSRFSKSAKRVAGGTKQSPVPAATEQARTSAAETLRPSLVSEAERLEGVRQARLTNRKARVGNIQVPF